MYQPQTKGLNISARSFIAAIVVIFILMVGCYILTLVIPGGQYARTVDAAGNTVIDTAGGFTPVEGGLPFWKWLLSPILVLGSSGSATLLAVIAFLLVIGGVFECLDGCGLMRYMLGALVARFGAARYKLMVVIMLFFMAMGALIGSFEECVPLVPIVTALAISLGWDALTGMGMSLLAVGCGFASGVCNPFTVGVAQQLAGLAMFSGAWMRILAFALIYGLLVLFVMRHAKAVERPLQTAQEGEGFVPDAEKGRALKAFGWILGMGIAAVFASGFITALQDYTMIIVAVMFLAAGLTAAVLSGMRGRRLGRTFLKGMTSILAPVAMILMASSIRYTLEEAQVLDTLLHSAVALAEQLPSWSVILFIYLIVLVMNFFIPSGSAKAFMLMPLIVPLAAVFGLPPQLCVLAFAFGDGFSNVFYPTNPALLISLGLADVSYGRWFTYSWKFQLANLVLTSLLLILGLAVEYA